ncbi:MAG: hypothetical protein WDA16_03220 [Candidatus Thermoplasmatota archaeon]
MAGLNPHLRKRQDSVVVRAVLSKTLMNPELLAAFARSVQGKMAAKSTIRQYIGYLRDALDYVRDAEDREIHVSLWKKETVWEYVHYVEANYCRNLHVIALAHAKGLSCAKRVWPGAIPAETATHDHCAGCRLFESSSTAIEKRLQALVKFFKFLARSGVIETNFVRDLLSEWREDQARGGVHERRRNPSTEEMTKLVNGTAHPRNRAFYAASAKWWFRPNEMLMLDRYASLGIPTPESVKPPAGFERAFGANPNVKRFHEGGDMVFLPDTKGHLDKRKGNRWSVIDDELRPILEQYLAWWERVVRRDEQGRPTTTALWLTEWGLPLQQKDSYRSLFYTDCERLGLMLQGERTNRLRAWTAHCQRHFGEKLLMMNNCPDTWSKHFRGDAVKDARGVYFVPTPEQIRQKYVEWVPKVGFKPLANVVPASVLADPDRCRAAYRDLFRTGIERTRAWKSHCEPFACSRIIEQDSEGRELREVAVIPRKYAPAYLYGLHQQGGHGQLAVRAFDASTSSMRNFSREKLVAVYERGLALLDA